MAAVNNLDYHVFYQYETAVVISVNSLIHLQTYTYVFHLIAIFVVNNNINIGLVSIASYVGVEMTSNRIDADR